MTISDDYIPGDPNYDAGPSYPVVFGVTLTPLVSGVLLALLGLGGAAYLLLNFVQPEWDKYQQLNAQVEQKKAQVAQQGQLRKQIEDAKASLETARKQRADVLTLFANESTLNTLVLDLNRQIETRNAGIARARQEKLASCPAWVRRNLQQVEDQAGDLVARAQLKRFVPDPKLSGVITDGSYGPQVNNKLKREVVSVAIEGNFNQTQSILRSIERLQPLLVFRNLQSVAGVDGKKQSKLYESRGNSVRFLPNCQPDSKITTTFQLEALLPLTAEESAAVNKPTAPAAAPK